jgi:hypothetical protein
MSEIGAWSALENFTKQRGVKYSSFLIKFDFLLL